MVRLVAAEGHEQEEDDANVGVGLGPEGELAAPGATLAVVLLEGDADEGGEDDEADADGPDDVQRGALVGARERPALYDEQGLPPRPRVVLRQRRQLGVVLVCEGGGHLRRLRDGRVVFGGHRDGGQAGGLTACPSTRCTKWVDSDAHEITSCLSLRLVVFWLLPLSSGIWPAR